MNATASTGDFMFLVGIGCMANPTNEFDGICIRQSFSILTVSMQVDQHDFHGLLHSADLVEANLRRKLAPLGIKPRQARVLDAMDRMGPVSQSELAAEFGITPASMSTMTDRLMGAGYITRSVDPASRRQNVLELTDKGRSLLAGIKRAWSEVDESLRAILQEDSKVFFDLSRRLRDGMGGGAPGKTFNRSETDHA